jgi:uncharacterized protein
VIVYADTSALAKLILEEEGSADIALLSRGADATASAAICYVELRSALAAAVRAGRVTGATRESLLLELERLWQDTAVIDLEPLLLRRAGDLAERMRLRAYDAVHLAALTFTGETGEVTFACWDADLRLAAQDLGYQVFPIAVA